MDVRMPDGTLITNVPEGTTQAQLMEKLGKVNAIRPGSPEAAMMSHPIPKGSDFTVPGQPQFVGPYEGPEPTPAQKAYEEKQLQAYRQKKLMAESGGMDFRGPWIDRWETQQKLRTPLLVTAGTLATAPMGGWGGLAAQSLVTGGMTSVGEAVNQQQETGNVNTKDVLQQGAGAAAMQFGTGALLKGLGELAKKMFYTPLDEGQQQAVQFAKDKGLKFPLSSAAPSSGAARTQFATRGTVLGDIKTYNDAKDVAAYLNRSINTAEVNLPEVMSGQVSPTAEAAKKGQQFLRSVFEPGEKAYKNAFNSYYEAVGGEGAIVPVQNTVSAAKSMVEALKSRGETGPIFNRLSAIAESSPGTLTAKNLDELYGSLIKEMSKNKAATGEASSVMRAIVSDMDEAGKPFQANFSKLIGEAESVRSKYRALKDIPRLESLSKEFGGRGGAKGDYDWMSKLFSDPDGRALAEVRKTNPELYHELADSWLAHNLKKFAENEKGGVFRTSLNGPALRKWFENNQSNLKLIYGAPQAKALDNFTLYASYMDKAAREGGVARESLNMLPLMSRVGGEATAVAKGFGAPIVIGSEAGGYVLAKGLSDPNSAVFKLFTEGVSDKTRSFWMATTGMASAKAGQEIAKQR